VSMAVATVLSPAAVPLGTLDAPPPTRVAPRRSPLAHFRPPLA
jgi:hypothetical protein